MHLPSPVHREESRNSKGDAQGGDSAERFESPSCGGDARCWRRGGNHSRPGVPQREMKKGDQIR